MVCCFGELGRETEMMLRVMRLEEGRRRRVFIPPLDTVVNELSTKRSVDRNKPLNIENNDTDNGVRVGERQ